MNSNEIKCPNCGHEFPVEDALFHQAEEKIRKEYEQKASENAKKLQTQRDELEKARKEFEESKENEEKIIQEKLKEKLEKEKKKLIESTQSEYEDKIKMLEEENEKRKTENKQMKQKEIELLKKENELKEKTEEMELEIEKRILTKRDELTSEIRKQESERNELRIKEFEKKLEDQKKLVAEMQRKAEQGSMQLQGEIQELALEDLLRNEFPFDKVEEVPKGVRGADVIQTVVNHLQRQCGKIIIESKRTKSFSDSWIDKLKEDQRDQQADVAVIITEALPADIDGFGNRDGVWITSFIQARSLIFVLREMIIKTDAVKSSEENKGDKMSMLYDYLVGEDFRQRVEAIVDGFVDLKADLDQEKRAMQKIWKKREKQIEKVIANTTDMYGSVKGIAGSSLEEIKALELPASDEE